MISQEAAEFQLAHCLLAADVVVAHGFLDEGFVTWVQWLFARLIWLLPWLR
jgi:hypothetical protein